MKIYLDIDDFLSDHASKPVLTIGNFDGLHLGHRGLIKEVCTLADKYGGTPVAMTFLPHPKAILTGQHPHRISTISDKVRYLEDFGIRSVVIQQFTWQLAAMEPEVFVNWVLERIKPVAVVLGYDFRFGARGRGSFDLFRTIAEPLGVEVKQADPFEIEGTVVSSSRIRDMLSKGDLLCAEQLLGRPYHISGTVIHGAGRGKTINVPTANIKPVQDLFLPTGIYAGAVLALDDRPLSFLTAVSLGYNPTFEKDLSAPSLEAHILDFDQDIYGCEITLALWKRLRGEVRYSSVEALVEQIDKDIQETRELAESRAQNES